MQIKVLVFRLVTGNQFVDNIRPLSFVAGVAEFNAVQAALQTPQVFRQAEDVA
jgi:hypothetical protein